MHQYELKIMDFMKSAGNSVLDVTKLPLTPAPSDVEYYLRKIYEDDPNRPFTIRMSNIGKPLCQLQMEKNKASAVDNDWNLPLKFMYGAIIEGLTVSVLKHSGINVEEEQTKVMLEVKDGKNSFTCVSGTLDLVVDGRVWDIKSASEYSYREKFSSYEALKEQDTFGYLCQIYGYAKARDLPPGGFIVVNKTTGEIKCLEVPQDYFAEQERCLQIIENNVRVLVYDEKFKRCFSDKDETFRKNLTGNKILVSPCTYCSFKYACWPDLKYLPNLNSTAYEKPYVYYTRVI